MARAGGSRAELPQLRAAEWEGLKLSGVLSQGTKSICTESQAQTPEAGFGDGRSGKKIGKSIGNSSYRNFRNNWCNGNPVQGSLC